MGRPLALMLGLALLGPAASHHQGPAGDFRPASAARAAPANGTDPPPDQHRPAGLHFGAKLALFLLAACLLLVLAATALDLSHRERRKRNRKHFFRSSTSLNSNSNSNANSNSNLNSNSNANSNTLPEPALATDAEPAAPAGQRDQRSPSLSSSCSSSLFSSANSLGSASAPILGGRFRRAADAPDDKTEGAAPEQDFGLATQILLCFSLRRSAAVIFEGANETRAPEGARSALLGPRGLRNALDCAAARETVAEARPQSLDSLHGLRFLSMIWIIVMHSYSFALRWSLFEESPALADIYKSAASQLLANGTFACDSFFFVGGFLLAYLAFPARPETQADAGKPLEASWEAASQQAAAAGSTERQQAGAQLAKRQLLLAHTNDSNAPRAKLSLAELAGNLLHRYIRMMPLMMALIGLSASLLRYLGEGPRWANSTLMFDGWCRQNWWLNALFLHNFLDSQHMCLSHSWYSAVDFQLFLAGQLLLFVLWRSRKLGLALVGALVALAQLLTGALTLAQGLPAVPLIAGYAEQAQNLYFTQIYVKPYCRASPYLIGMALAYLMRTTALARVRLSRLQAAAAWALALSCQLGILLAMLPAMNGRPPTQLQSALYSALSRPLWACATGWTIFACVTGHAGPFRHLLAARAFVPLSRLTYPAFLVHPVAMAAFYGSREANSLQFSHYLMLYLVLGNVVITYASAFVLSALFELPLLSAERAVRRLWAARRRKPGQPPAPAQGPLPSS